MFYVFICIRSLILIVYAESVDREINFVDFVL